MNLSRIDAALQDWVDHDQLPGVSYAVVRGAEVVARGCVGWADKEQGVPLREDHLFRIFSNTKLVTSCAALQLLERGHFSLDDAIGDYIPALARLQVLRPGATSVSDTEPAREAVRIRHLLTHTAGLTYGFLDPEAPIAKAYMAAGLGDPSRDLAQMCEALGELPLLFPPGSAWNYSVATDVVGRLVEVVSGETLESYFQRRIFEPLNLRDTGFFVPESQAGRLATMYIGSLSDPGRPGLRRADHLPYPGAYRQRVARLSGGGGLVSSLDDFTALVRALLLGGGPVLEPSSLALLFENQLPPGQWIGGAGIPAVPGRGHSLGGSVTVQPTDIDPDSAVGELQWGGLAGTKWCISPQENLAAVLMTQRYMGSDLPVWSEFKREVRAALR